MTSTNYTKFFDYLSEHYLYSRYSYFINFMEYNLKKDEAKLVNVDGVMTYQHRCYLDIENSNGYEIFNSDVSILAFFYDLINIFCKYVYLDISVHGNYDYYESTSSKEETDKDIPDIIAIEYNNKTLSLKNEKLIKPVTEKITIKYFEDGIIFYKGHQYKLDYILHFNDNKIKCSNKDASCGHCISAITYGGEEYIYDSDKINRYIDCPNDEKYKMPCSLIKQKWNKNINNELTYCTTNCEYNVDCKLDKLYRNNLCYTFNYNLIYVYVRID